MRRVSSRQRLVSWDAFDAAADDDQDVDSDAQSHHDNLSTSGSDATAEQVPFGTDQPRHQQQAAAPVSPVASHGRSHRPRDQHDHNHHHHLLHLHWHHRPAFLHMLSPPSKSAPSAKRRSSKRSRRALKTKLPSAAASVQKTTKVDAPAFVPAFSWEMAQQPPLSIPQPAVLAVAPPSLLDHLNDDVQMSVFSFLDVRSLRSLVSTNKKIRRFVLDPDRQAFFWNSLGSSKAWWSAFMPHQANCGGNQRTADDRVTPVNLYDAIRIPCAATNRTKRQKNHQQLINLPLYCGWIPDALPTSVHKIFARGCPRWRSMFSLTATVDPETNREWIKYTGQVGTGDRCIRADHPLPRPVSREHKHHSILDILCRGKSAAMVSPLAEWRPFCAPHRIDDDTLDISPRMVSYFEVTIQPDHAQDGTQRTNPPGGNVQPTRSDCVAVGVATESFPLYSRMPGWDRMSFGYHGDDGGIFHASGNMLSKFGPSFGAGDTVGCGIDYVAQSIFYTLNGEFLGHAWKHLDWELLQNKLYPVVGVDTNNPLWINFGQSKFQFDLATYMEPHHELIQDAYSLIRSSTHGVAQHHAKHCNQHHHHHDKHLVSAMSKSAVIQGHTITTTTTTTTIPRSIFHHRPPHRNMDGTFTYGV
mmetsp:Transcript_14990/g.42350  ORF Transcript_14990/g.42350 Transcript_14990/m.42350 type:complete len:641 (+) Transcript_14990:518-2440(+)|eukprot:CAMPEP_0119558892 /NCGR_PEP_ID=MMETSP1352-20130426/11515_1 /TAXON_ID=265584 /ORGANISM="Stauroneis constricta, Strain CCMP1120" /LENGTH=640 /DNA_ID=CAMNT_0007606391 /DNA_START=445 /DNA_END=2367 /DNA_ORIENTATION=+